MPKLRELTTVEAIHAELEKRYEAIFGRSWDETPWGTRWSLELADAKLADNEYLACVEVLCGLDDALAKLRNHVARARIPTEDKLDAYLGRTYGDVSLGALLASHGAVLDKIAEEVRSSLRLLHGSAGEMLVDGLDDESRASLATLMRVSSRAADELGPDPKVFETIKRNLRTGATRRLRHTTIFGGHHLPNISSGPAPAMFGCPRLLDSEVGWLRLHLVQVLELYPMKPVDSGVFVPPTDSDIAVVSLLAGVLETMKPASLRNGLSKVLANERKAIAAARRRNTLSAELVERQNVPWDKRFDSWVNRAIGKNAPRRGGVRRRRT